MAIRAVIGVLGIAVFAGCSGEARQGGGGSPSTATSTGGASGAPDQTGSGGEETGSGGESTGAGGSESGSGGTGTGGSGPGTGGAATDGGAHLDPTSIDRVDANLARLRALDVFDVGKMVIPGNTYCLTPCADPAWISAATALEDFATTAETAVAHPNFSYACTANIDTNLATLRALGIVDIGAILVATPANNPQCYNLPCQSDTDAANAKNNLRAELLESITWATETPAP